MVNIDELEQNFTHQPVLLREVLEAMAIRLDGDYLDLTVGGAGHSSEIFRKLGPRGHLCCFDQDREALDVARKRLEELKRVLHSEASLEFHHANFSELETELARQDEARYFDAILADIGVSSYQLDEDSRGFSYQHDGPLDMRMNREQGHSAAELVNSAREDELAALFKKYGEERYARRIAAAICSRRASRPFDRTTDLADCIRSAMPARSRHEKQHPAKRCFQALRIAVNQELDVLETMLDSAVKRLKPGGRLLVITFHSLEDRIVKQCFRDFQQPCHCPPKLPCVCHKQPLGRVITSKGLSASPEELAENPRARSARLRVFERASELTLNPKRGDVHV
ncbi:MAG: 16S rRNA (cytosine(1402)-N(4))-methyltransferase RsmH [Eubacteriales bacterium]|nr:16S rRNA (cytosine(1402)-N(4))-methyltransferase RsmH [Eubacteriales bacterium]